MEPESSAIWQDSEVKEQLEDKVIEADPLPTGVENMLGAAPEELRQHEWTGLKGLPLDGLQFLANSEWLHMRLNPRDPTMYNMYIYKNRHVLVFEEPTNWCCVILCPGNRPFDMPGRRSENTVMMLRRPLRWESAVCGCFCCCCLQKMIVEAPESQVVGYVQENCSIFRSLFTILDAHKEPVLKVGGVKTWSILPCCPARKGFGIETKDRSHVIGYIIFDTVPKLAKRLQRFIVAYPKDLDVGVKATLIGCAMLLRFMFYDEVSQDCATCCDCECCYCDCCTCDCWWEMGALALRDALRS
ncbi:phospholipid scramblase 3-like isoform X2 [Ornithodoros turicata]|uniref:phospholipid scramblase 3-like isoform X2 n=1 Tax=Ornithodoros turicata TaxID=34597 RepID=UPI00313A06AE